MLNRTDAPYLLHGFEVSYFTAKVRCALRYKQLWFEECRADMADIIRRTGLAFIPIVITPEDATWQDSSEIFDLLEQRHPDPPLFPDAPVQTIAAHLIELYTDEFATMPAMHTRWALSEASTRQRFGAMLGSNERGNKAADQMIKGRFALGADDAAGPVLNAHIRDLLDALSTHLQEHPYMLGERMSFADCALMGPLHAHFFTDLASREILLETATPVVGLIERCNAPTRATQGDWQENGGIADSLAALLAVMGRDAAPILLASIDAVQTWADQQPDDELEVPRSVGWINTELRDHPIRRIASSYTLFQTQRVLDAYAALSPVDTAAVDIAFAGTGFDEILALRPRHRFEKKNFQLVRRLEST